MEKALSSMGLQGSQRSVGYFNNDVFFTEKFGSLQWVPRASRKRKTIDFCLSVDAHLKVYFLKKNNLVW